MLPDELDLLLVEDDPLEAELILRPLHELGTGDRIAVAGDGEEALDYLLARGPFRHRLGALHPRLVVLELKLPRLDGLEVLRALRASPRTSIIPVVMLTSAAEPREVTQCYQLGANGCVRKPTAFDEFAGAIRILGRYWLGINRTAPPAALMSQGVTLS
jgi:two-component system response regulator